MEKLITLVSFSLFVGILLCPILVLRKIKTTKIRNKFLAYLTIGLFLNAVIVFVFAWWSYTSDLMLLEHYGYDIDGMNETEFCYKDFDFVLNKMMAGWQPNDHEFTSDIIDHIAIHEMGHAVVGLLSKHHSKVSKVVINLSSPKSPGYTVFEGSTSNIYVREALFEHLMILLAGRIAEEVFYGVSVTTGAINDFEEALKLAERMIIFYGMGSNIIYPSLSEKYKELIDNEVVNLLNDAYKCAHVMIQNAKDFIGETSEMLKKDKLIRVDKLNELIQTKYKYLENNKIEFE